MHQNPQPASKTRTGDDPANEIRLGWQFHTVFPDGEGVLTQRAGHPDLWTDQYGRLWRQDPLRRVPSDVRGVDPVRLARRTARFVVADKAWRIFRLARRLLPVGVIVTTLLGSYETGPNSFLITGIASWLILFWLLSWPFGSVARLTAAALQRRCLDLWRLEDPGVERGIRYDKGGVPHRVVYDRDGNALPPSTKVGEYALAAEFEGPEPYASMGVLKRWWREPRFIPLQDHTQREYRRRYEETGQLMSRSELLRAFVADPGLGDLENPYVQARRRWLDATRDDTGQHDLGYHEPQ